MTKEILLTWIFAAIIVYIIWWKLQSKYDLINWWFSLIIIFGSVAAGGIVIYLLSL